VGFSNEGCNLYTTLSMKIAGSSCPSGPTATILMDHFRMGKPSPAGGTSDRICYTISQLKSALFQLFRVVPAVLQV